MVEKLLLVREVAARLNVSGEKVRSLVAEGRLPGAHKKDPEKATSPIIIPESSVVEFERKRDTPPIEQALDDVAGQK